MSNIINGNKLFLTGGGGKLDDDYVYETNEQIIQDIIKVPAVAMRGHRDELTVMDAEADPPVFKWNMGFLQTMDNYSLRILRTFAEKRQEAATKKY